MKIRKYQNGGTTFDYKETPRQKGERLLIDLELGSRFDSEGKRKKGEEKKLAKEMREFTGLDKEKMDRQENKGTIPARFRGRGQEGLDAYRAMMARKRRRGSKSGFEKLINALTLSFLTRRGEEKMRSQSSGAGSGCEKTGTCGAFD
jgi:hypothetical protein